jgi:hypothetical protein
VIGGRSNEQHGAALTVIIESPAAMKDALAVLPELPSENVLFSACGTT